MSATNGLNPPARPPYLGAAYYPEDWPFSQVDEDIALMQKAGLNCVRMAEFAWSTMEPEEGRYEFGWLHEVVEKLGKAGIASILGTPTATPPAWLSTKHPEILFVRDDGSSVGHGGRRHYDPCSRIYREYSAKIVTKMAEAFGEDERVIGWQIDNELFPHNSPNWWDFPGSSSPEAHIAFVEFLRRRFGTVDNLNREWCTNLWSQTYDSFEQVPFPEGRVWHHPSLKTCCREFAEWAYYDYAKAQAEILHHLVRQPVGTNMMPLWGLDFTKMNEFLDVAMLDHYTYHANAWQAAFWYDILRPAKPERPYWNVETGTSWSGATATSGYSEKGYCVANSWLPIALGGEMTSYWLWRTHWAGQELTHGAVLQSTGRPFHIFGEVQEIGAGFRRAAGFINGTRPVNTGLAIHCSTHAYHTFREQNLVNGFEYGEWLKQRIYRPLMQHLWRPDLIHPSRDLTPYKVVISPFLPSLDEDGLRERLKAWIEAGGTWIAGPFTDFRTMEGGKYIHAPYGSLEEWAGLYTTWDIPGEPRDFALTWWDGRKSKGGLWYNGFELNGSEPLATYDEYPFEGQAAVASKAMEKGRIVVLGTLPVVEDLPKLLEHLALPAGVQPAGQGSDNLLLVPRAGEAGQGLIVIELENKPGTFTLEREATDLLTGERVSGLVQIAPYGVKVLRYS